MIFQWSCGNISVILHKNLLVLWPNFTVFLLRNSIGISVEFWWNLGEISPAFSPGECNWVNIEFENLTKFADALAMAYLSVQICTECFCSYQWYHNNIIMMLYKVLIMRSHSGIISWISQWHITISLLHSEWPKLHSRKGPLCITANTARVWHPYHSLNQIKKKNTK